MIADNELSNKRAKAGKKGGEISQFGKAFAQANIEAASENEYENENEDLGKESIERGTHSKLKKQKIPIETKLQKYIFDNLPNVSMLKKQLTKAESENLTANFDKDLIIKTLKAMENKVDLTKKYASVNLTLQNWMNRDKPEPEQEHQSGLTADDILRKNLSTEAYEKLRSQNA
jgi:protein required for attachment to host cells